MQVIAADLKYNNQVATSRCDAECVFQISHKCTHRSLAASSPVRRQQVLLYEVLGEVHSCTCDRSADGQEPAYGPPIPANSDKKNIFRNSPTNYQYMLAGWLLALLCSLRVPAQRVNYII
jgi:hypothetical protein